MRRTVAWMLAAALVFGNAAPITAQAQELPAVVESESLDSSQESESAVESDSVEGEAPAAAEGTIETDQNEEEPADQVSQEEDIPEDTKDLPDEVENGTDRDLQEDVQDGKAGTTNTEDSEPVDEVREEELSEDAVTVPTSEFLNYMYMDYPEVTGESYQNIVLSVGSEGTIIEDAVLTLEIAGQETEVEADAIAENAILFSGSYGEDLSADQLKSLAYTVDGVKYQMNLTDCEMENIESTVGEEAQDTETVSPEIQTEVVTFDAEGNAVSQNSISDALENAGEGIVSEIDKYEINTCEVDEYATSSYDNSEVKVVLDPGHDNSHAGARANGLNEESLTLKIAQYCKAELEKYQGVKVYMTRSGGSCPYPGTSSTDCNTNRVEYAKNVGADVFVSIHLNSGVASAQGAEVYYPNSHYTSWIGIQGKELASKVEKQLAALGLENRGVKIRNSADGTTYPDGSLADYYGVIRRSKLAGFPGIIIEHAFLTNAGDVSKFLNSDAGLKKLGEADAVGIAEYFGLSKDVTKFSYSGFKVTNVNTTAGTFTVNLTGVTPSEKVQKVRFAVWCTTNGQNDLKWYEAKKTGTGSYTYTFRMSDHKFEEGTYQIHAYTTDLAGNEKILTSTTTTMSLVKPTMGSLKVTVADAAKGLMQVIVGGGTYPEAVSKMEIAVWSQSNRSDFKWYTLTKQSGGSYTGIIDIANHNYNYGTYNVHVYITSANGQRYFGGGTTVTITPGAMKLSTALNSSETSCRLTGQRVTYAGGIKSVKFAVWSEAGGQDDLKWYTAAKDASGNWIADVNISNHKTAGRYQAHMYAVLPNGSEKFLTGTSFNVSNPSVAKLAGESIDSVKGTFVVRASGISAASGIASMRVAVWSQSNQKDLKWYTMLADGQNSYSVPVSISNHNWNYGTYNVHVYATTNTGIEKCANATTVTIAVPKSKLSVSGNADESNYRITASNVAYAGGIKGVRFAVWSEAGGQDDLKWYSAVKDSAGNWLVNVKIGDHKTAGKYQAHMYLDLPNGTTKFANGITFNVSNPHVASLTGETLDSTKGTFVIKASGVTSVSGISDVRAAVWSQSDQKDLKWYTLNSSGAGTYTAGVNIADHNWNYGKYNVHVYVTTKTGIVKCANSTVVDIRMPASKMAAVGNGTETNYRITASNVAYAGGLKGVKFAVWSEAGGQDDLKWYSAVKDSAGNWGADVKISNHKTAGRYQAHLYVELPSGVEKCLNATTFTVSNPDVATLLGESIDSAKGIFVIRASGVTSVSGVDNVKVAVWSQSNQKDLKWYDLTADGKGNYVAQISIANHNWNYGTYTAHVYVTGKNGVQRCANRTTVKMSMPASALHVIGNSNESSFHITASGVNYAGGLKGVKFAVWSEAGGQDDLKWYPATRDSSGNWVADVKISEHKTAGKYQAHMYAVLADGSSKFLNGTSFDVKGATVSICKVVYANDSIGKFSVWAAGVSAPAGIARVEMAVWSKKDVSDVKWYNASKQNDGTYIAEIDTKNHGYNLGTYTAHVYVTDNNGVRKCANGTTHTIDGYKIMGTSGVSLQQMVKYYNANASYPSFYQNTEASSIEDFCRIYLEECAYEGVKAEVAFCQAMKETNWLRYTGDVNIKQYNFAGLGATGNGASGNYFESPRIGIRAQIQHLKAYATTDGLNLACADPRYEYVIKGSAPYVEWLGKYENPYRIGWATAVGYGTNIVTRIKNLKTY